MRAQSLPLMTCLALAGCAGVPGDTAPSASDQVQSDLLSANGLSDNGLSDNGLSNNGLSNNGLSNNGLSNNGLSNNGLSNNGLTLTTTAFKNWFANNPTFNNTVMQYVVKCALPAGDSMSITSGGKTYSWPGSLGLLPKIKNRGSAMTTAEEETLSACLLAHTNAAGRHIPISVMGVDYPVLTRGTLEKAVYPLAGGSFFGNLFADASGKRDIAACYPHWLNDKAPDLSFYDFIGRSCFLPGGACAATVNILGACDGKTDTFSAAYALPQSGFSCTGSSAWDPSSCKKGTKVWSNIVTIRLPNMQSPGTADVRSAGLSTAVVSDAVNGAATKMLPGGYFTFNDLLDLDAASLADPFLGSHKLLLNLYYKTLTTDSVDITVTINGVATAVTLKGSKDAFSLGSISFTAKSKTAVTVKVNAAETNPLLVDNVFVSMS